eukprot:scaffold12831_cov71-Phaeocystis_antarctica.AAC.2
MQFPYTNGAFGCRPVPPPCEHLSTECIAMFSPVTAGKPPPPPQTATAATPTGALIRAPSLTLTPSANEP